MAGKAAKSVNHHNINHNNEKHTYQAVHYSDTKYFARDVLVKLPHIIEVNVSRSHTRSKLALTFKDTSSPLPETDEGGGWMSGPFLPCVLKPNGGK